LQGEGGYFIGIIGIAGRKGHCLVIHKNLLLLQ
jgi:hypothetical protein